MSRRPILALVVAGLVLLAGCSGTVLDPGGPTTADGAAADTPTVGSSQDGTTARQSANGTTVSTTGTSDTTSDADGTTASPRVNGTLSVRFIDVGQGGSVLVVGPTGETMLIDTGGWQDDGEDVLDALDRANVTRVDHLVTSHADADHIGGHAAVIEHLEERGDGVGAVYDPGMAATSQTYQDYLDAVERYDLPLFRTVAGDSIPLDGATVSVLAPPEGLLDAGRNENSIVLRVTFGLTAFLFTGDAEEVGEEFLVEEYGSDLGATVLQAGHHGSRSSNSEALLDAVHPRLVVVSSAYDSPYDHPHGVVLARLAARDVPTFWTGVHGSVVVESDGEAVTVLAERAATVDPTRLRDAGPFEPATDEPGLVSLARLSWNGTGGYSFDNMTVSPTPGTDGTPQGSGPLRLVTVHADAAGSDGENLEDEYLVFENAENMTLNLSGWTVRDAAGHEYTFPDGTTVEPGERLTLRTGSGVDSPGERYWGASSPVWNNGGDTVIVESDDGSTVLEVTYGGG